MAVLVVAVEPVEEVEGTVRPQGKEIVARDVLGLTGLLHHEQLWQNRNSLKVDGEGPQDLYNKEGKWKRA